MITKISTWWWTKAVLIMMIRRNRNLCMNKLYVFVLGYEWSKIKMKRWWKKSIKPRDIITTTDEKMERRCKAIEIDFFSSYNNRIFRLPGVPFQLMSNDGFCLFNLFCYYEIIVINNFCYSIAIRTQSFHNSFLTNFLIYLICFILWFSFPSTAFDADEHRKYSRKKQWKRKTNKFISFSFLNLLLESTQLEVWIFRLFCLQSRHTSTHDMIFSKC
jgi:hypothetical protein